MPILIYGATGFTGALIAHGLASRQIPLVLSGRDKSRLDALARRLGNHVPAVPVEVRPAPMHDRAALDAALAGVDLVVSCAGPFARIGEPLVAAAIEHRVHYLDIAGEQSFLREVYERYESPARHAGVLVASGMAFQVALGDLAASLASRALCAALEADRAEQDALEALSTGASGSQQAGDTGQAGDAGQPGEAPGSARRPSTATGAGLDQDGEILVDEIFVAYAMNRFPPTAGVRLTAAESLARQGWMWTADRWDPVAPLAERRVVNFGPATGERTTLSFPFGEVITVPRHIRTRRVQTYLSLLDTGPLGDWMARLARLISPTLPALFRSPLAAHARAQIGARPLAPSDTDRKFATFAIVAEASRGFERARCLLTGVDPYSITAELACLAVDTVLGQRPVPTGVLAPAQVLDPVQAMAHLAARCGLVMEHNP